MSVSIGEVLCGKVWLHARAKREEESRKFKLLFALFHYPYCPYPSRQTQKLVLSLSWDAAG